ncbi:MAG TPA: GntR family transcriptional regulator [Firmicutes bacterium]|nr:GntR family transcriptional regulator [Bacillota bacterium]
MKIMKKSITDQMFSVLKEEIVRQRIKAGEQINPRQIAEEHGVSVMPVRDALTRLASFGLVTIRPRVGFFAREFTPTEVREIFEVRRLHEMYCMERYFHQIDIAQLEQIAEAMDSFESNPSREAFDSIDEALHDLLIAASQNRFLMETYNHVKDLIILIRHLDLGRIDYSHAEHRQIVDAIRKGDKALSLTYLKQHLDSVRDSTLDSITVEESLA